MSNKENTKQYCLLKYKQDGEYTYSLQENIVRFYKPNNNNVVSFTNYQINLDIPQIYELLPLMINMHKNGRNTISVEDENNICTWLIKHYPVKKRL